MGISFWQVGIILLIVVLLFGTKKLRNVGSDLGGALKGFKKAMSDDDTNASSQNKDADFDAVEDQTKQQADAHNTQTKQTTSKD